MSQHDAISIQDVEVVFVNSSLPDGAEKNLRIKFAESQRRTVVEQIVAELTDGTLYRGDWRKGEIEITGIKKVISNRFWTEIDYEVLFPPKQAGATPPAGSYRVVRWNAGIEPGTAVLCLTRNGDVVLTRNFRHATRSWEYEIPRGLRADETLEECGLREASEEAGITPTADSRVIDLGQFVPDSGMCLQIPRLLLVTNVEIDEDLCSRDVSESAITTLVLKQEEVCQLIDSGKIRDGFTIAAMLKAGLKGYVALSC